jgi:ABC-type Fe3+/spermidine/putrescine transport system ATPase subunit
LTQGLTISGVRKSFGGVEVLRGIDLTIQPGEFFTLLGPSGCGKTTLLRIIAGFQMADQGSIALGGARIDQMPAHRRDIGMVFQDYAVFPHLTVADNIAFGLKTRGLPKAEIDQRVAEGLKMVRLDGLGQRYPAEMSGGQQQRVGIARAMVIRPKLILMDEPLSNLDAKLRIELRDDIRALQKRLGVAAIYVTHDQEEALAISDRIAVMNGGVAEQVGTPSEIYRYPQRRFPAGFVGTMNFLHCQARNGRIDLGGTPLTLGGEITGPVEIGIRPEHLVIAPAGAAGLPAGPQLAGTIARFTYLGTHALLVISTALGELTAQVHDTGDGFAEGAACIAALPYDRLNVFAANGDRIGLAS